MTAALSNVQYIADGVTTNFGIPFGYINEDHIVAVIDEIEVPFVWVSTNTIQISPAPADGLTVEIQRRTPRVERLVTFVDGSTSTAKNNNLAALQILYVVQEAYDNLGAQAQLAILDPLNEARDIADLVLELTNAAEDQEVAPGIFSALHWRAKATLEKLEAEGFKNETIALRDATNDIRLLAIDQTEAVRQQAILDTEAVRQLAITDTEAVRQQAITDTTAIVDGTDAVRDETIAVLADFRSRYYGELIENPLTDPNGDPVVAGDLYWNSTTSTLRIYNGATTAWQDAGASTAGIHQEIATAAQATFTVAGGYVVGFLLVFLNGVRLADADYTANDGSTVTLASGAAAGDVFSTLSFGTFDVANTYTKAEADDTFVVPLDFGGPTVAQVGKGAIVESGTNSNGSYVRWENGEQLATRRITDMDFNASLWGDNAYSFAVSFLFIPSISASSGDTSSTVEKYALGGAAIRSGSTIFRILANPDDRTTSTGDVYINAWGFWK